MPGLYDFRAETADNDPEFDVEKLKHLSRKEYAKTVEEMAEKLNKLSPLA